MLSGEPRTNMQVPNTGADEDPSESANVNSNENEFNESDRNSILYSFSETNSVHSETLKNEQFHEVIEIRDVLPQTQYNDYTDESTDMIINTSDLVRADTENAILLELNMRHFIEGAVTTIVAENQDIKQCDVIKPSPQYLSSIPAVGFYVPPKLMQQNKAYCPYLLNIYLNPPDKKVVKLTPLEAQDPQDQGHKFDFVNDQPILETHMNDRSMFKTNKCNDNHEMIFKLNTTAYSKLLSEFRNDNREFMVFISRVLHELDHQVRNTESNQNQRNPDNLNETFDEIAKRCLRNSIAEWDDRIKEELKQVGLSGNKTPRDYTDLRGIIEKSQFKKGTDESNLQMQNSLRQKSLQNCVCTCVRPAIKLKKCGCGQKRPCPPPRPMCPAPPPYKPRTPVPQPCPKPCRDHTPPKKCGKPPPCPPPQRSCPKPGKPQPPCQPRCPPPKKPCVCSVLCTTEAKLPKLPPKAPCLPPSHPDCPHKTCEPCVPAVKQKCPPPGKGPKKPCGRPKCLWDQDAQNNRRILLTTVTFESPPLSETVPCLKEECCLYGAKAYEPWVPIPSWPHIKKQIKRPLQTPAQGCPRPPRSPNYQPCHQRPCEGFPNKYKFADYEITYTE